MTQYICHGVWHATEVENLANYSSTLHREYIYDRKEMFYERGYSILISPVMLIPARDGHAQWRLMS